MAISLTIDGAQVALKKGSSIEYVSENRIFTDADDYSLEIELPVGYFSHARQCPSKLALHSLNRKSAECPQNIAVFGHLTRKDIDTDKIFFNAVLQDTKFRKVGAVVITGITNESVKVQFLEKRSYQNFYPHFDETYIDELDLGEWPHIFPDNISSGGMSGPRPGWEDAVYMTPVARPLIEALDYAQWTNTIGSLRNGDVSRTITAPAVLAQSQAPMVIVQQNNDLRETLARLNERLNEPFVTVNTITGDMGIKQAQDDYQRLMNNKSPKNKRR